MSDSQRTITGASVRQSRRSAIRTGGLAAIMAGLIGTTTPPVAAQPAPALTTIAPVLASDLEATSRAFLRRSREGTEDYLELHDAFTATFTPEQRALWLEVEAALGARDSLAQDLHFAEVVRHFPGLAPALWTVYRDHDIGWHDRVATCCTEIEA
jgi:hypothetical protein